MAIHWLDSETVTELNKVALYEGERHALNPGSDLEGALNRPWTWHRYEGVSSLPTLAAVYAVAIVRAHPFQDGNKRTALLAIRAFLRANAVRFDYGAYDKEAAEMMTAIARHEIEVDELAEWIESYSE
ncbi:MAG: type II toxin-antitoxin system death-on-curing family toxin [Bacteroidetes bacterium]|jgi:death-on-curing protein|nr:type II toxin-antitoxin system death-on-curing family toxin [Bacteroidota bacterium]